MLRSFEDKSRHDSLVRMMAKYYDSLGYTAIRADIDGYATPPAIWWKNRPQEQKIPDLTCYKNDSNRTLLILEAETGPSLSTTHIEEEWRLFEASARQNNGEFHVVVPNKEYSEIARKLANELGITVNKIWWPKE